MGDYRHEVWCQHININHEEARRIADTYNLHHTAGGYDAIGKWFAASLQDGSTDGVLYDTKRECVRHQKHNEWQYMYQQIKPSGMNPCVAEVMLKSARQLHDAGARMADRDAQHGGMEVIKRIMVEDQLAMLRGVVSNVRMPWER